MKEVKFIILGLIIGITCAFIGSYLFIQFFTAYEFWPGIQALKAQKSLGKLIALGAVPNLIVFFILLKLNKELMARGVVLATLLITLITLFV
ncbi:hypothetical protein [Flavobacterium sp.]|uniref:hypothetical protein n=1 Tax=Flavobacterium sp. TaxID=239 RepID=UPI002FDB0772